MVTRFDKSINARAGPGEQLESMKELLVSRADLGIVPFLLEWRDLVSVKYVPGPGVSKSFILCFPAKL